MPQRKAPFVEGEFYHIYNRGNSRQKIFKTDQDYQRFLNLLFLTNGDRSFEFRNLKQDKILDFDRGEQKVAIGAFCLMPNHFHILLTPLIDGGVTEFMQKLTTSYSMYFNKKHHRTGSLFEGRFKSEHASRDNYLKYLLSYIHLNPVKLIQSDWREKGIVDQSATLDYLDNYHYSSYSTKPECQTVIDRSLYPDYFETKKDLDKEMLEWLMFEEG